MNFLYLFIGVTYNTNNVTSVSSIRGLPRGLSCQNYKKLMFQSIFLLKKAI